MSYCNDLECARCGHRFDAHACGMGVCTVPGCRSKCEGFVAPQGVSSLEQTRRAAAMEAGS